MTVTGSLSDDVAASARATAPMRPLNRLEALGWAFLAQQHLGLSAGEARALQLLACERPGRVVSSEDIQAALSKRVPCRRPVRLAASTRLARVRGALVDVGFCKAVIENLPREGYRIRLSDACQIRSLIEDGGLA